MPTRPARRRRATDSEVVMAQIPDSIRPYIIAVQKFHFWILAAVAPLVLLPLLFMARSGISAKIQSQRSKVTGAVSSLEAVLNKRPHPNETWSQRLGKRAQEINDETLQAWEQLWEAQKPLRQWPEFLGDDFIKAAGALTPDGTLKRSLRERYQNDIRAVPRELPARMGVDDFMGDATVNVRGQPPEPGRREKAASLAQWSQADQQQIYESFQWDQIPSTTQIVMAQEELWMYGVLCDVIRKVNSVPAGADSQAVVTPANIPIPLVSELKVGYPAAEDDPGGRASQRIFRIERSTGDGPDEAMPFPDGTAESGGESASRPPHPRFGGGTIGSGMGSVEEPDSERTTTPDDAFKNWVYVDLDSRPLMATELNTSPTARMLRLMPFLIRATLDQRALDSLLVELASAPVPIDTRQVRINTGQSSTGGFGNRQRGGPREEQTLTSDRPRLHDVRVELRGTLAIVMQPDPSLLEVGSGGGRMENPE